MISHTSIASWTLTSIQLEDLIILTKADSTVIFMQNAGQYFFKEGENTFPSPQTKITYLEGEV